MSKWSLVIAWSLVVLTATVARGAGQKTELAVLDAEDLGVSLARIQRKLDRLPDGAQARSLLRLNYYVQVYAKAPPLTLFRGFDVHNGPVPYGTPMHNDMLNVMHPNELYPSAVNLNPVLGWAWRGLKP